MDDRPALPEILATLRDHDQPLGPHLAFSLSSLTKTEAQQVIDMLHELDVDRRRNLYALLVDTAEAEFAVDLALVFALSLNHPDHVLRRHAIRGLWEDPKPSLAPILIDILQNDPEVDVRAEAASALARYIYAAEFDEMSPKIGDTVREALESVIHSDTEEIDVRRRAVEAIAFINDDAVRQIIDIAYDDDHHKMQVSAVFAMGRSADTRWAPQVMQELGSSEPELCYEATRAAGEMQLRQAVPIIAQLVDSPDRNIQQQAIWSLGQIGGDTAHDLLVDLAESDDKVIAAMAEEALEECDFADMIFDMMVVDEDRDLREMDMSELDIDDDDDDIDALEDDDKGWDDDVISLN